MNNSYTFESLFGNPTDTNQTNNTNQNNKTTEKKLANPTQQSKEVKRDLNSLILEKITKVNENNITPEKFLQSKRENTTYKKENNSEHKFYNENLSQEKKLLMNAPSIHNIVHVNNYNINNFIHQPQPITNNTNNINNINNINNNAIIYENIKSKLFQLGNNNKKAQSNNPLFKNNLITEKQPQSQHSNFNNFNINTVNSNYTNNINLHSNSFMNQNTINKYIVNESPKLPIYDLSELKENEKKLIETTIKQNNMESLKHLQIYKLPDTQKYLMFIKKYVSEISGPSYTNYIQRAYKTCENSSDLEKVEFYLDNLFSMNNNSLYFFKKNWDSIPLPDIWNINQEILDMYRIKRDKLCNINNINLLDSNKPKVIEEYNKIKEIKSIKEINNEIMNKKTLITSAKKDKENKSKNKTLEIKSIIYQPVQNQAILSKIRSERFSASQNIQNIDMIGKNNKYIKMNKNILF